MLVVAPIHYWCLSSSDIIIAVVRFVYNVFCLFVNIQDRSSRRRLGRGVDEREGSSGSLSSSSSDQEEDKREEEKEEDEEKEEEEEEEENIIVELDDPINPSSSSRRENLGQSSINSMVDGSSNFEDDDDSIEILRSSRGSQRTFNSSSSLANGVHNATSDGIDFEISYESDASLYFSQQKGDRRIFLNDPAMMNEQGVAFKSNRVKTTKYTKLNFIFKNMFEQFRRLANFYFLMVGIVTLIPNVSPITPVSTILPLVIVIGISALKDAYEDYVRSVRY